MIKEFARAKINLTLDILGVRPDGYHEVSMIMQSIELADEVTLNKISHGINFTLSELNVDDNIPRDEKNLAWRAAIEFQKFCGYDLGVSIELTKKIPSGAGLAGGSSDAAAVLRGLNKLYDTNYSDEELCTIGARIGSDIPFCIVGGTCLATGRGEILTELKPLKKFYVVLAKPRGEISTAWSYKTYDENPVATRLPTNEIINQLANENYYAAFKNFSNVLEPVALKKFPVIATIKSSMIKAGARVALMSGSGPTVFALIDEERTAEKIANEIQSIDVETFVTKIFAKEE